MRNNAIAMGLTKRTIASVLRTTSRLCIPDPLLLEIPW
jgi:hypothetical protein